jgi:crotonobetainyl-CoA:carnitine CoA-transferase CaiB-like acyl-CoA transferase
MAADDPAWPAAMAAWRGATSSFAVLGEEFAKQPWNTGSSACAQPAVPCGAGAHRGAGAALGRGEGARQAVTWIPHPTVGPIPNVAPPWRFSDTPVADPVAAPTVGQHTQEVLQQVLGCERRTSRRAEGGGCLRGRDAD